MELSKSLMTFGVEITDREVNSVMIRDRKTSNLYPAQLKALTPTRYLAVPDFSGTELGAACINADKETLPLSESSVYDINGRMVRQFPADFTALTDLPKGIYIIKCGATSRKIRI